MRTLLLAVALAAATPALAQHADHGAVASAANPADAFAAINAKMHADMSRPLTGNVDVDFLRGMIPHHEAAIAMAEVALQHSQDADVRRMAEAIIVAQKAEISAMQTMLARISPDAATSQ